jgi:type III pantothenate kinase
MILAVDVGNSNILVGCIQDGEILCVFRLATNIIKTEDEYASSIKNILEFHDVDSEKINGAVISSVVPPLTGALKNAVKLLTGVKAIIVGSGIKTGINILIDDPAQLGSDIVATAVGALSLYKLPVIIVDLGTATKLSAIDKSGNFIGCAVVPGVSLSVNALSAAASQLPKVPIEVPLKCIGTNSIDSMKSGAVFGTASMIDGMAERFETELGASAQIVATGGLAEMICHHTKRDITIDTHLVLRGLQIIYEKNVKK